jgi:hypothetical protein
MKSRMLLPALLICIVFVMPAFAWENPNERKAVPFEKVTPDRPSRVTLEARRVASIDGDTITYNLGKKSVSIQADSFNARRFVEDVKAGRASAKQSVLLKPKNKSPFNESFWAR